MDPIWNKIVGLNLKSVRNKFSAKKSWWWHLGHDPARIEAEYRQFLFLLATHPDATLVPWSPDLDDFWHQHILDTPKYAADCDAFADRLIHHPPHPLEGSAAYSLALAETRKLYLSSFSESARKRKRAAGEGGHGSDTPMVFSDSDGSRANGSHHAGGHGLGHHSASHHSPGLLGSADHGGGHGGHSCGGHGGGHSCGGHSGCGGHGGH
jgi:hypothetical protein